MTIDRPKFGLRRRAAALVGSVLLVGGLVTAVTVLTEGPSAEASQSATGPGGGTINIVDTPPYTNGQIVTVQGAASAFPTSDNGKTVQIEECSGTQASPPASNTGCDAVTLDTSASINPDGSFIDQQGNANGSNGVTLSQLSPSGGSTITCDPTHSCVLYVGINQNNFSQDHVFLDIVWSTATAPVVTTQPVAQVVTAGSTASFTAAASGSPAPTVQWQVSTDGGATFTNVSGATSTTLSFSAVLSQNGNEFRAVFTNSAGSATSNAATLTVNAGGTARADLSVHVFGPRFARPGKTIDVWVLGYNAGPDTAQMVSGTLNLPAGATVRSAPKGYVVSDGHVLWSLPFLRAHWPFMLEFRITLGSSTGSKTFSAQVMSLTADPAGANNSASFSVMVVHSRRD